MGRAALTGAVRWRWLLGACLLALVIALGWGGFGYSRFVHTPLRVRGGSDSIDIKRGSFKEIVAEVYRHGLSTAHWIYWRALAEQMGVAGKLHAGEYALVPGMTPRGLLQRIASGKVLQHRFTIVDGWTFLQLRQALAAASPLRHASGGLDEAALMGRLGFSGERAEGRFLPETYAYVKGDSDLDLLKRAHTAMSRTLDEMWPKRAPDLPLATPYEALTLASIVEKETASADERPRIAGVFVRRLQKHMLLQTDPAVIYGLGQRYDGKIHKLDLSVDTPYNTYTRAGLPPTPIALPGRPALQAALHPAAGDELYFVARGDGSHVFARTLDEHDRNVACYQLKRCR